MNEVDRGAVAAALVVQHGVEIDVDRMFAIITQRQPPELGHRCPPIMTSMSRHHAMARPRRLG